jgi:DNA-directed RNA polymerase subunit RPC12/RpoP
MRKDYGNRCSGCTQIYREMLELDCGHPVCITCLEHLVKREENQEELKDGMEIECPSCSYETIISIALAYKLIRPAR